MKLIYEAKITSVLLLESSPKHPDEPRYRSCVEWRESEYSTKTIYISGKYELGQTMWVMVSDTDPSAVSGDNDAFSITTPDNEAV